VRDDDLLAHALEAMARLGVETRRLFGSHGLYRKGRFFGLVSDRHLYFHSDSHNRAIKASATGRS
jgi:TfoX/Sxy family transcriptional regulator of competence genes